jgi:hypothetical protein
MAGEKSAVCLLRLHLTLLLKQAPHIVGAIRHLNSPSPAYFL